MTLTATAADVISGAARWACLLGDVRETLRPALPDGSIQCAVTSPPYYGLRDYGTEGQIGLEQSPQEYVAQIVAVMREVRRVLRDDGTLWLNLGDSYAAAPSGRCSGDNMRASTLSGGKSTGRRAHEDTARVNRAATVPEKNLLGIPWRVAFALQEDGWWLRSDIVWAKPNPMPESVTDRPTRAHEYVFLLTKSARYFYDAEAVREPHQNISRPSFDRVKGALPKSSVPGRTQQSDRAGNHPDGRNARSVWTITPEPYSGAHFATMPPELARRCILAGSRKGDVVLDPFGGSGTTALVAVGHGRRALLCELNPAYAALQRERLAEIDTDHAEPLRVERADFGPLFAGGAR